MIFLNILNRIVINLIYTESNLYFMLIFCVLFLASILEIFVSDQNFCLFIHSSNIEYQTLCLTRGSVEDKKTILTHCHQVGRFVVNTDK